MKESENIQLKLSELRQKINAFGGDDETEYRAEEMDAMTNEYQTLESRYRMAVIKESAEIECTPTEDLDGEKRESRTMEYDLEVQELCCIRDDGCSTRRAENANTTIL